VALRGGFGPHWGPAEARGGIRLVGLFQWSLWRPYSLLTSLPSAQSMYPLFFQKLKI